MRRDAKGGQVCKVDDGVVEPELVRHVSRVLLTAKRGRFPLLATVGGRQTIGAIHSSLTAQPLNSFPVTVNLDWVTHSQCSSTLFFFFHLAVRSMRPLFTSTWILCPVFRVRGMTSCFSNYDPASFLALERCNHVNRTSKGIDRPFV